MRPALLFLVFFSVSALHLVHADQIEKEPTEYIFKAQKADSIPVERHLPRSRRSVTFKHPNHPKSAVKQVKNDVKERPDIKKRVRFFVHEHGDMNLIDNQGNDYVSTDDEEKESNDHTYRFGSSHVESSSNGRSSPPPRSASWSATARQRQERILIDAAMQRDDRPTPRSGTDLGERSITSNTMEYKRQIVTQIRLTETKIKSLLEWIADEKQERCEAAKYNLMRVKLLDYHQHNRVWNARIRVLKHELSRQEHELDYYEHELVVAQRRLQSAIRHSQRAPITMSR